MFHRVFIYIYIYIRKRKANCIGHILRRNCLVQHVIEGKIKGQIEVTRRRGRRRKKLLDNLKDRRGYCRLKEEALDRAMWRNRFGRGFGPVVWQITDYDDQCGLLPYGGGFCRVFVSLSPWSDENLSHNIQNIWDMGKNQTRYLLQNVSRVPA